MSIDNLDARPFGARMGIYPTDTPTPNGDEPLTIAIWAGVWIWFAGAVIWHKVKQRRANRE